LPGGADVIEAVNFLEAAMICPYCDMEYTAEHPCFCQPRSAAGAHPEKFTLVPPPEKEKGVEHPPTGLNNPFWN
jgi:hypothetical protein